MYDKTDLITEGTIPLKATFTHSHTVDGPAKVAHPHDVDINLTFRAMNSEGITLILDPETEKILKDTLKAFFEKTHIGGVESAAHNLFNQIAGTTVRELKQNLTKRHGGIYDFQLQKLEITVPYDGTSGHPETPMTFTKMLP